MDLVFDWVNRQGGLAEMQKRAQQKSGAVYGAINASGGFYSCPVLAESRSRINIPFRIEGGDKQTQLEEQFLSEALARGMIQLKGHRYFFTVFKI
jgi:phosphoserine aminotransferase